MNVLKPSSEKKGIFPFLATLPATVIAVFPSVFCPACYPALAVLLSSFGLGFFAQETILQPLTIIFLLIALGGLFWESYKLKKYEAFLVGLIGALGIYGSHSLFPSRIVTYVSAGLLIGASIWNFIYKKKLQKQEECCSIPTEKKEGVASQHCPICNKKGKKVKLITLFQLIKHSFQKEINRSSQYYFCDSKACEIVYFSNQKEDFLFKKEHLIVKVGQKENTPRQVCYCFDYTDQDILEEIQKTGKSTAVQIITQNIKEGLCACEMRNPQGSCCLGNVREAEKWAYEKCKKKGGEIYGKTKN